MSATDTYRTARDLLLDLREDPDRAHAEFSWPDVGERFNWAVDWFDAVARGNDKPALVIVEEDGTSTERTLRRDGDRAPTGSRPGWPGKAYVAATR